MGTFGCWDCVSFFVLFVKDMFFFIVGSAKELPSSEPPIEGSAAVVQCFGPWLRVQEGEPRLSKHTPPSIQKHLQP